MIPGTTSGTIREAFGRTEGIDSDANAVQATRLSLALLHLVATGELPQHLNVKCANAISEVSASRLVARTYGAIITNPPYVKYDYLSAEQRETYRKYLSDQHAGRLDAYAPFVKLCLELVEPGGFVCMVLPQVFLTARNAAPLRRMISNGFDVRCLIDLSSVRVFEHVNAYSILLVVQRRQESAIQDAVKAYVAQATEFVGAALQACLDSRAIETPYHSVFPVGQAFFRSRDWVLVSP
jgi:tRNA1(Val) A37 N6-methylase TrmN6